MIYSNIMEEIKSTRDFKKTKIKKEILDKIAILGKNALSDHQLEIRVFEDGVKLHDEMEGKAGYYGKFIEAPHYIAVIGSPDPANKENAGYVGEMVRFAAHEEKLGSCWITVNNSDEVRKVLGLEKNKAVLAFIGIGQIYSGIFKKDIQEKSFRQGATEITFLDEWGNQPTWEELEDRGFAMIFYLTRFAPSWGNRQPWKFLITKNQIASYIEENAMEDIDLDFGIVRFYFEKACVDQGLNIEKAEATLQGEPKEGYQLRAIYSI